MTGLNNIGTGYAAPSSSGPVIDAGYINAYTNQGYGMPGSGSDLNSDPTSYADPDSLPEVSPENYYGLNQAGVAGTTIPTETTTQTYAGQTAGAGGAATTDQAQATGGAGGTQDSASAAESGATSSATSSATTAATATATETPSTFDKVAGEVLKPYVEYEQWKSGTALGKFESGLEATGIGQTYEKFENSIPGQIESGYSTMKKIDFAMDFTKAYRSARAAQTAAQTGAQAGKSLAGSADETEKPVGTLKDYINSLKQKYGAGDSTATDTASTEKASTKAVNTEASTESASTESASTGADAATADATEASADFSNTAQDAADVDTSLESVASGAEAGTGAADGAEAAVGAVEGVTGAVEGVEAGTAAADAGAGVLDAATTAMGTVFGAMSATGIGAVVVGALMAVGGFIGSIIEAGIRQHHIDVDKSNENPRLDMMGDTDL